MGLLSKAKENLSKVIPTNTRKPYPLRQGTTIDMVEVPAAIEQWARESFSKVPRYGHQFPVEITTSNGKIMVTYQGRFIGIIDPKWNRYYYSDLESITQRNMYGATNAAIKPEGAKSAHCVFLNYGKGAHEGGIL